jgi:hypothetical protein
MPRPRRRTGRAAAGDVPAPHPGHLHVVASRPVKASRGRHGAATQRSPTINHGAQWTTRPATRRPYRAVGEPPCRLWHARGHELNRLNRYRSCRGVGAVSRFSATSRPALRAGRLRRPSSADSATVGGRPASLALNASPVMALAVKRADIPNRGRPGGVAQAPGRRTRSVEARSQSDALVGCIVWLTTASSSADSVSRSISSRRRALNAAIVWAAS